MDFHRSVPSVAVKNTLLKRLRRGAAKIGSGLKKGSKNQAIIVFIDECGFSSQPVVRRTWAKRGQTPIIQYSSSRRRLSATGAICLSPGGKLREHFQIEKRGITANDLFWFLINLCRHYKRPLIVVWDNWSVHHKVERWCQQLGLNCLSFERLPPYAPELNPVEFSWSQTKYHDMSNYVPPTDTEHWISDIQKSFRKTNRRKKLLKSFFKGCKLSISDFK